MPPSASKLLAGGSEVDSDVESAAGGGGGGGGALLNTRGDGGDGNAAHRRAAGKQRRPGVEAEIVFAAPTIFSAVLTMLDKLIETAKFELNSEGLRLSTMDGAQTFVVALGMDCETAFTSFWCSRDCITFSVQIDQLTRALKHAGKFDSVTLTVEADSVILDVAKAMGGDLKHATHFKLTQIILVEDDLAIPDIDYDCVALLPSATLVQVSKELAGYGETITIEMFDETIVFDASSHMSTAKFSVTGSDPRAHFGFQCRQHTSQMFNSSYVMVMLKTASLKDITSCMVYLNDSQPLQLLFEFGKFGTVSYFLAPMVEE